MNPGMVLIIIQDPGPGDSTLVTRRILDGVSVGDIARAGSVMVTVLVMVTVDMDMGTEVVVGGVLRFIIRLFGVVGMEVQDLMASMEIISMYEIIFT